MSNIITIQTDIEPPLVAVALSDWNALNQAHEAAMDRAEAAERRVAELEARLATTETQRDEYIALHDQDVIRIAQLVAWLGMLGSRVDFERLYNGSWDDEGE